MREPPGERLLHPGEIALAGPGRRVVPGRFFVEPIFVEPIFVERVFVERVIVERVIHHARTLSAAGPTSGAPGPDPRPTARRGHLVTTPTEGPFAAYAGLPSVGVSEFEKAITPVVDESGTWSAEVAPGWDIGGRPHGGYLLAITARIALEVTGREHPLAISAHFLRSPAPTAVTASTRLLRAGRSTAVAAVDLHQDGEPILAALTTAGRAPGSAAPVLQRGDSPALPAPGECVDVQGADNPFRQKLHEKIDIRLDPGSIGWAVGNPRGTGEIRGWVRLRDGSEPDALFTLLALDALPPTTFDFGLFGWAPTVELTALLRGAPAPGWLRVVMRSTLIDDGWLDEDVEVWDSTNRLVAQGRQLAAYRTPPPAPAT